MWGHFCLCYDGQKLLKDSDYIGDYDIRDGDQVSIVLSKYLWCTKIMISS